MDLTAALKPLLAHLVDGSLPQSGSFLVPKVVEVQEQPRRLFFDQSCPPRGHSVKTRQSWLLAAKEAINEGGSASSRIFPRQERTFFNPHPNGLDHGTEGAYLNDNAIDDDDSSEWEDSDECEASDFDEMLFQRVKLPMPLRSRPSLITLMLVQENHRTEIEISALSPLSASRICNASRFTFDCSTTCNEETFSMTMGTRQSLILGPNYQIHPPPCAKPITSSTGSANYRYIHAQAAKSPWANRCYNMLARTDPLKLPDNMNSLRRYVSREQQQESSTAVSKRQHIPYELAHPKPYAETPCIKQSENIDANIWNQYCIAEACNGYHWKGW